MDYYTSMCAFFFHISYSWYSLNLFNLWAHIFSHQIWEKLDHYFFKFVFGLSTSSQYLLGRTKVIFSLRLITSYNWARPWKVFFPVPCESLAFPKFWPCVRAGHFPSNHFGCFFPRSWLTSSNTSREGPLCVQLSLLCYSVWQTLASLVSLDSQFCRQSSENPLGSFQTPLCMWPRNSFKAASWLQLWYLSCLLLVS